MADCGINKNGVDQIAYAIYGPGGTQDAHSMTAHNVFCNSVHMQIIEIEDEAGNKIVFGEEQKIKIKRDDLIDTADDVIILGKEFQPTDTFIDYVS